MKETIKTVFVELSQRLNYWQHFAEHNSEDIGTNDMLAMITELKDTCKKLENLAQKTPRYSVFYDVIGQDNGDAGESVYHCLEYEDAKKFYFSIEGRCDFILWWDRLGQRTILQKGR